MERLSVLCVASLCCLLLMACEAGRIYRFFYVGCFVDLADGLRDLVGLKAVTALGDVTVHSESLVTREDMSQELCAEICSIGGFPFFGVQFASQCFCGNNYGSNGKAAESDCSLKCSGNSRQVCGASSRNSVFALTYPESGSFIVAAMPSRQTVAASKQTAWQGVAQSDSQCLIECSLADECQAVIFSQPLLTCHLLAFIFPPPSLNNANGTLYVKR